eukprot:3041673-Rhodomonas_salina.1
MPLTSLCVRCSTCAALRGRAGLVGRLLGDRRVQEAPALPPPPPPQGLSRRHAPLSPLSSLQRLRAGAARDGGVCGGAEWPFLLRSDYELPTDFAGRTVISRPEVEPADVEAALQ